MKKILTVLMIVVILISTTSLKPFEKRIENKQIKTSFPEKKDRFVPIIPEARFSTLEDYIRMEAVAQNLDPDFIWTICKAESGINPYPKDGTSGEIGPMQLMPTTAGDVISRNGLKGANIRDPKTNVRLACLHIKWLKGYLGKYGNDKRLVVLAYNWGPGNAKRNVAKYGAKTVLGWFKNHPNKVYRSVINSNYQRT